VWTACITGISSCWPFSPNQQSGLYTFQDATDLEDFSGVQFISHISCVVRRTINVWYPNYAFNTASTPDLQAAGKKPAETQTRSRWVSIIVSLHCHLSNVAGYTGRGFAMLLAFIILCHRCSDILRSRYTTSDNCTFLNQVPSGDVTESFLRPAIYAPYLKNEYSTVNLGSGRHGHPV
jgi:hypothetical protein